MKVPGRFVGTQSLRRPRTDYGDYVLSRPDTEYKIRLRNLSPLGTRAVVEVFVDGNVDRHVSTPRYKIKKDSRSSGQADGLMIRTASKRTLCTKINDPACPILIVDYGNIIDTC